MEARQENTKLPSGWNRAEQAMGNLLRDTDLYSCLPSKAGERTVAILGAGAAVEVCPISDLFLQKEKEKPKVIAFDLDVVKKVLTERFLEDKRVNLDYRIGDIRDESSYGDEQYDLVIIRNPDVHNDMKGWRQALSNVLNHLKKGGVILFTATEPHVIRFAESELGRKDTIVKKYGIIRTEMEDYVSERQAFIAKKV